jgi:hypothetical protein
MLWFKYIRKTEKINFCFYDKTFAIFLKNNISLIATWYMTFVSQVLQTVYCCTLFIVNSIL